MRAVKHGAPHEIFRMYNVCKTFGKLPSEIEREDPIYIDTMMTIEAALASKGRNQKAVSQHHDKINKKRR